MENTFRHHKLIEGAFIMKHKCLEDISEQLNLPYNREELINITSKLREDGLINLVSITKHNIYISLSQQAEERIQYYSRA